MQIHTMVPTYHIRIKKDYATSVIEDLRKMDAIEFIDDSESREIPSWQREEVNQRIKKYENSPEKLLDEATVFKILDAE